MNCADANSCKAAGVMRRARLEDLLHKQTVSVLRGGYKRVIMNAIITIDKNFDVKRNKNYFNFDF